MAKVTLNDIASGYGSSTKHNTNNDLIEAAIENTLSRDGTTPNEMEADLDMNGHCLLNVGCITYENGPDVAYLDECNLYLKGQATQEHAAVVDTSIYTPTCCDSNVHRILLEEDITIDPPVGPLSGQVMNFIIVQDTTGGWAITWDAIYKWPSGTAPTITTTANAVDIVTMQYDAVLEVWYCVHNPDFQ